MRTCVYHGEEYLLGHGRYRCTSPENTIRTSCDQPPDVEHPPCFVPLPAAPAPEAEVKVPDSSPVTFAAILRYHRRRAADPRADRAWHAEAVECLRELAGYLGVPDSSPVTFAAILRYHRRRAADPRADRAWHAEAVECLRELAGYLGEVCRPCTGEYDGEVCQRARCPIWRARKAVEVER